MTNDNCQDYDCGMESLLLGSNIPFHFSLKGTHTHTHTHTHTAFLLIFLNNRQVNRNRTFQRVGFASLMFCFSFLICTLFVLTKWLTQIFVACN